MIIFVKIIVYWWLLSYLNLFCLMVRDMDNNEKSPQEEKKLKLDLHEAMMNGFDDDDDIIELKDEVTLPPKETEAEIDLSDASDRESSSDEPTGEAAIGLDALGTETAEPEDVLHQVDELIFDEEDESWLKHL
jgi:hypothetical protein